MLIAFLGKKRSGKTTCADYLVNKGFKKVNFKDALIDELKENFPDLLREIGDDFNDKTPVRRALLQNYGTEVRRRDDEDYWVKKWEQRAYGAELTTNVDIVVDDCRFLNEAEIIKKYNGIIIKVEREGYNGDNHQSETEQDQIKPDFTIQNNSTVYELYEQINKILLTYEAILHYGIGFK